MPVLDRLVQPLRAGERLSREEFLSRWEALPDLRRAALIEGRVYLPSPVSNIHDWIHTLVILWLGHYAAFTPGCRAGLEGTWLMLKDAPQPDTTLRILAEFGGQSRIEEPFSAGAPELVAEISASSAARDLGPKLRLYRSAGVREYANVLVNDKKVIWRILVDGDYQVIEPDPDGILRSGVFPGLWLDVGALFALDSPRLLAVLQAGLNTPEHEQFVGKLSANQSA